MNKPELSILLPSIRPQNLEVLYESILSSTKRTFELIVVGPYPLPKKLQDLKNVKYVKDFGSPTRCTNIAFQLSEGQIITDVADDALYLPNSLDESIDLLYSMPYDYKNVVIHSYYESQGRVNEHFQGESYYKLNGADCSRSKYIPDDWWIFNSFVMYREFFEIMGGLDCTYEATAMAHLDQAVRYQKEGAIVQLAKTPITSCDHGQSDHGPIEVGQIHFDQPLYQLKYGNPSWVMNEMMMDINNWKNSPTVWERRFK